VRTGRAVAIALLSALVLAGCGPDEPATPPDEPGADEGDPAEEPDTDPEPLPDGGADVPEPGGSDGTTEDQVSETDLEDHVRTAREDLASAEGVDPDAIEVVSAEAVTWPDGSLGCPEPDGMYTQALVEGYRIVLRVEDTEVAYHGQLGSGPFRCDRPVVPDDPGA
jgi:hypothetical protein